MILTWISSLLFGRTGAPAPLRFALVSSPTGNRTYVDAAFYSKGPARFYAEISDPAHQPLDPQPGDRLVSVSGNAYVILESTPGCAPHEAHVLLSRGTPEYCRFVPTLVPTQPPAFA